MVGWFSHSGSHMKPLEIYSSSNSETHNLLRNKKQIHTCTQVCNLGKKWNLEFVRGDVIGTFSVWVVCCASIDRQTDTGGGLLVCACVSLTLEVLCACMC